MTVPFGWCSKKSTPGAGWPAAGRAPATPGEEETGSAGHHVDDDGRGVAQHVVDGRPAPGLLDDRAQRLVVGVALDLEGDVDLLVAVADRAVGQPEDAEQVDVAGDRRGHLAKLDAARG